MNFRKPVIAALIFLITIVFSSCRNDSPASIINETPPLFSITVKDTTGNPMKNLQVSAWNQLSPSFSQSGNVPPVNPIGSTTIRFYVIYKAKINLSLYGLNGKLVSTPIPDDTLEAGVWECTPAPVFNSGTRVYKCVYSATNLSTDTLIFRDSIYMTRYSGDYSASVIGYTSEKGYFSCNDALNFPALYTLPVMTRTSTLSPDSIGSFTVVPMTDIYVTDTLSKKTMHIQKNISAGANNFEIIWRPSTSVKSDSPCRAAHFNSAARLITPSVHSIMSDTTMPPAIWKIYQNRPNPFN